MKLTKIDWDAYGRKTDRGMRTKEKIRILEMVLETLGRKNDYCGICASISLAMYELYVWVDIEERQKFMDDVGLVKPAGSRRDEMGFWWPLTKKYQEVRINMVKNAIRRQKRLLAKESSARLGKTPKKISRKTAKR